MKGCIDGPGEAPPLTRRLARRRNVPRKAVRDSVVFLTRARWEFGRSTCVALCAAVYVYLRLPLHPALRAAAVAHSCHPNELIAMNNLRKCNSGNPGNDCREKAMSTMTAPCLGCMNNIETQGHGQNISGCLLQSPSTGPRCSSKDMEYIQSHPVGVGTTATGLLTGVEGGCLSCMVGPCVGPSRAGRSAEQQVFVAIEPRAPNTGATRPTIRVPCRGSSSKVTVSPSRVMEDHAARSCLPWLQMGTATGDTGGPEAGMGDCFDRNGAQALLTRTRLARIAPIYPPSPS